MTTETATPTPSLTVDLTGLPEPVVRQVQQIVRQAREQPPEVETARFLSRPRLSIEESRLLLDQMAAQSSGNVLPADFSRADLYDDYD